MKKSSIQHMKFAQLNWHGQMHTRTRDRECGGEISMFVLLKMGFIKLKDKSDALKIVNPLGQSQTPYDV